MTVKYGTINLEIRLVIKRKNTVMCSETARIFNQQYLSAGYSFSDNDWLTLCNHAYYSLLLNNIQRTWT